VVASEVRRLSARTARAAEEIQTLVKDSNGKTSDAQKLVEESGRDDFLGDTGHLDLQRQIAAGVVIILDDDGLFAAHWFFPSENFTVSIFVKTGIFNFALKEIITSPFL
jgi:hypothetical protein